MKILLSSIFLSFFLSGICLADPYGMPTKATDAEIRLLPEYCLLNISKYRTEALRKKFNSYFQGWKDMHHYCNALTSVLRSKNSRGNSSKKNFYLEKALGDYGYVVRHADKDFFFLYEVYFKMAKVYEMQKKYDKAIISYQSSIRSKKDYSKSYRSLAKLYYKMGYKDEAIKVLKEGLKHRPKSKTLKKYLKKYSKK